MATNVEHEAFRTTAEDAEYLRLAQVALAGYDLPEPPRVRLISLSENATFLLEGRDGPMAILRLYRDGYQSVQSMDSELAWITEVSESGLCHCPRVIPDRDGARRHEIEFDGRTRSVVMFEHIAGTEPDDADLDTVRIAGAVSARLHQQVRAWQKPAWFERGTWSLEEILGDNPTWGRWQDGPGLTEATHALFTRVENKIREHVAAYELTPETFGLVHCDLRAANLVRDADGTIWVIDFDDSGFSWFLWDLCSTTTIIEHKPNLDEVVRSWIAGYQSVRPLSAADIAVIPHLVMLRRLHILAWLGTHPESGLTHSLRDTYVDDSVPVAERYLRDQFLTGLDELLIAQP